MLISSYIHKPFTERELFTQLSLLIGKVFTLLFSAIYFTRLIFFNRKIITNYHGIGEKLWEYIKFIYIQELVFYKQADIG